MQRRRLCESIRRVDPIASSIRWQQLLKRRVYNVPGPNALWHIDGNHSLIRWRFVIHGAIDGYSRLITYLHCSTNNRSETVYNLFVNAVDKYGCPSRVRSDKGGENQGICIFMVQHCGTGRHSHIAGPSTHNQRIERLWRDVYRCVASTFHALFYHLEEHYDLDPSSEFDLFILHTVFLPRINHCLNEFTNSWNNHPMRDERNWSPRKMWLNGMVNPINSSQTAVQSPEINPNEYGVDFEGPLSLLSEANESAVVVPETIMFLERQQLNEFVSEINPLEECHDYGIGKYVRARQLLL